MDHPEHHSSRSSRKRWNPLAVVLLLSGGFFVLFLILSATFFYKYGSKPGSTERRTPIFSVGGSVGVVELRGVILDSKKTLQRLKELEESPQVKALVVRLDSPGGAVAPSQEIYDAVRNFSKPIVVSMGSVAASGAFYVACGAKYVFANPGTLTGSIGVIMEMVNLKKLFEWAKIERSAIKTGKYKDTGAEFRDMRPDEKQLLQALVDDTLTQFKKAVQDGRKLSRDAVDAVADGRIMTGAQAKRSKLVDELGGITEAIAKAGQLGGIKGKPEVIYMDRKTKFLDYLLDRRDEESEANWLGGLMRWMNAGGEALAPLPPGLYSLWRGA